MPSVALRVYTILVACWTYFLVIAGGAVTSTGSGLAVPDWPLSFGTWNPPMVGGVFFEHGHRMVATFAGLLTVILAVWLTRAKGVSGTLRQAGYLAVGLVVVQGLFGGITVLLRLPAVTSVTHACLGQIYFAWMVTIAWMTNTAQFQAARSLSPEKQKLYRLAAYTTGFVLLQLLAGAIYRHTGKGLHFHFLGAALVLIHVILVSRRTWRTPDTAAGLRTIAGVLAGITAGQISLGFLAWLRPMPFWTTAHQSLGALLLATSIVLTLHSVRERVPRAA